MRTFSKVSPLIWREKRFCSLASSDARLCYIYYCTNEHLNSSGCYRLPETYAAGDLQWTVERYRSAAAEVQDIGLIILDPETSELFIVDWFKSNPITNEKHADGTRHYVERIQSEIVGDKALGAFNDSDAPWREALRKKEANRFDTRLIRSAGGSR